MNEPCLVGDKNSLQGDSMSINQCETIREKDDSKLVGAAEVSSLKDVYPMSRGGVRLKVKREAESAVRNTGKKRRGRPPRGQDKVTSPPAVVPASKQDEEDVCFICFDGGSLVLCDRRGCPKAYHPACIKRDEAFFRSKAKWSCGWHICTHCMKASHYMCCTCTYSVCKGCIKDADYLDIRGNKGFCGTCMRTIMLIENAGQGDKETVQVDFDDKSNWEYLFKVYWVYMKGKLSLTSNELTKAINHWNGVGAVAHNPEILGMLCGNNDDKGGFSNSPSEDVAAHHAKKRKVTTEPLSLGKLESLSTRVLDGDKGLTLPKGAKWATNKLLEFVAHVRNGDISVLSLFDTQALFLEYVKRNNLRDSSHKSQIVCDLRLLKLFGKERVGHFEMLKLIESQFLIKESSSTSLQGGSAEEVDTNNGVQLKRIKRRKTRCKNVAEREPLTNPDDYATVDIHNMNLIYLRRNMIENLLDDAKKFHDKVVGSIVRIRISSGNQEQDMYRLVRVVGTSKVAETHKICSRTTNFMLEILNSGKKELISMNELSNQDFSEDECASFGESIKCGLIKRLTVGEIREKASILQVARVNDGLEAEMVRIRHLHDRASEKGHQNELGACVEKIELLNSSEVCSDSRMNLSYESEGDEEPHFKKLDIGARSSSFLKKETNPDSGFPQRGDGNLNDARISNLKPMVASVEKRRNDSSTLSANKDRTSQVHEGVDESALNQERESLGSSSGSTPNIQFEVANSGLNSSTAERIEPSGVEDLPSSDPAGLGKHTDDIETRIMWNYLDPMTRIQGPFSLFQLRKWSTSGHFPPDLKIWRIEDKQVDSILLTDALDKCYLEKRFLNITVPVPKVPVDSNDKDPNCNLGWSGSISESNSQKVELSWNSKPNKTSVDYTNRTTLEDLVNPTRTQKESGLLDLNSFKDDNPSDNGAQVSKPHPLPLFSGSPYVQSHDVKDDSCNQRWKAVLGVVDMISIQNAHGDNNNGSSSEKQGDSEGNSNQSSGQNWKSQPVNISSNGGGSNSTFLSSSSALENSKQNQEINFLDLSIPTPKSSSEDIDGQVVKFKQSESSSDLVQTPSDVVQTPGLSCSTASSLVSGRGQPHEVAGERSQSSPTKSKHLDEWDPNEPLPYMRPTEVPSDHAATPTSGNTQVTHCSPPQPLNNASDWQAIMTEPNECDESVSDLLAELEAMESLNGLASPTSILRQLTQGSDDDCFSPLEVVSPARYPGKSDDLMAQSVTNEPLVFSHHDFFDLQKVSGGHSSSGVNVSGNQCEAGSQVQPPTQPVTSCDLRNIQSSWRIGSDTSNATLIGVQNNTNEDWEGLPQASWGTRPPTTTTDENPSVNLGSYGSQARYFGDQSSAHDFNLSSGDFQDRHSGFGRSTALWNSNSKQLTVGSSTHGVGSFRSQPEGLGVCKFYESGYCEKGALCRFWHPT